MEKNNKKFVIAVDGPSAAGKTVLSKRLAEKLSILHIDTGAMYRAVALFFIENNIEINEENANKYIDEIYVELKMIDGEQKVYLNGEEVTDRIRTQAVSMGASDVSKYKLVREKLVDLQRELGSKTSVVLDGRDIGTVVFKDATLKIFLTASVDVRAKRRQRDLEKKGEILAFEEVRADIEKRDLQDTTRKESPLRQAEDAILIDTSEHTNEMTTDIVVGLLKERI